MPRFFSCFPLFLYYIAVLCHFIVISCVFLSNVFCIIFFFAFYYVYIFVDYIFGVLALFKLCLYLFLPLSTSYFHMKFCMLPFSKLFLYKNRKIENKNKKKTKFKINQKQNGLNPSYRAR